jgi:hypothetical protein
VNYCLDNGVHYRSLLLVRPILVKKPYSCHEKNDLM